MRSIPGVMPLQQGVMITRDGRRCCEPDGRVILGNLGAPQRLSGYEKTISLPRERYLVGHRK